MHLADLLRLCAADPRRARGARPSVVHLLPTLGWGGAERLACTIHRLCLERGLDSRLDAPGTEQIDAGIAAETGQPPAPRPGPEGELRAWALAARGRVARERPAVVHAHLPYPDRFSSALLAARGRPLVATFQLLPLRGRSWSVDELLPWRSDNVLRVLSRAPGRVRLVVPSVDDEHALAALVPRARLLRIPNAPPLPRAVLPAHTEPRWPEGSVRLLSVGRLHAQKGFDRMLSALAAPSVRALAWHWVVAGDGPERDALARAVEAAGLIDRVTFAHECPASVLYPRAELVLSPSRWEGMPLVPMEAVEAGVPVLASAIAPHGELFRDAPSSLLPADESRWAESLVALLAEPAARHTLAAEQRRALPRDPRAALGDAYLTLYRTVSLL